MTLSEAKNTFMKNGVKSPNTAKLYRLFLEKFILYIGDIEIEEVRISHITEFENYHNSISTRNQTANALLAVRSFFRYFRIKYDLDVLDNNKISIDRPQGGHWKNIPIEQLRKLFASFDQEDISELRNLCICMTFFCTGARSAELLQMTKSALDWKRGEISIIGKGDKKRILYFTNECLRLLKKYINMRTDDSDALFVCHCLDTRYNGKPIGHGAIRTYMPMWGKKVGIERLHAHTLRKSFGTELYRRSGDIRKIQMLMGHSSVETTQVYTIVEDQELKDFHTRNMGNNTEFKLTEKREGNIIYEITGFCSDCGKLAKLKRAIKQAADEILA